MPRDKTLEKIELEIDCGRLGIARDRLHGLVASYPDDLEVRTLLGNVYHELGYPALAGRWWFFSDAPETEETKAAQEAFMRAYGGDAAAMLRALRLPEDYSSVAKAEVAGRIDALIERCRAQGKDVPPPRVPAVSDLGTWDRPILVGCALIALFCLYCFGVGFSQVLRQFFS